MARDLRTASLIDLDCEALGAMDDPDPFRDGGTSETEVETTEEGGGTPPTEIPEGTPAPGTPPPVTKLVDIASITRVDQLQLRGKTSEEVAARYAELLDDGVVLPPVVVFQHGETLLLADGFHTTRAHELAGRTQVMATIHEGSMEQALFYACGANNRHGLHLPREAKRRIVEMLLQHPQWSKLSTRKIAAHAGVSHTLIVKVRAKLDASTEEASGNISSDEADEDSNEETSGNISSSEADEPSPPAPQAARKLGGLADIAARLTPTQRPDLRAARLIEAIREFIVRLAEGDLEASLGVLEHALSELANEDASEAQEPPEEPPAQADEDIEEIFASVSDDEDLDGGSPELRAFVGGDVEDEDFEGDLL